MEINTNLSNKRGAFESSDLQDRSVDCLPADASEQAQNSIPASPCNPLRDLKVSLLRRQRRRLQVDWALGAERQVPQTAPFRIPRHRGKAGPSLLASCLALVIGLQADVCAALQSVEIGPFAELPGQKRVAVEPSVTYLNLIITNIVNNSVKPWFAPGDSTIAVGLDFYPLGLDKEPHWTYAQTFTKVGKNLQGTSVLSPLGKRMFPLPNPIGEVTPILRAHIIELDRNDAYGSYVATLNKALASVPNPYAAGASTTVGVISDLYDALFKIWLASNKQDVELNAAGFSTDQKDATIDGSLPRVNNPLFGNVVYLLISNTDINGQRINLQWAIENLKLDPAATQLVFAKSVDIPANGWRNRLWFGDIRRKENQPFDLTSYMLLQFKTRVTEFAPSAMFYEPDLERIFQDAKSSIETRLKVRRQLADNMRNSNLLNYPDIYQVLLGYDQYMSSSEPVCAEWTDFWKQCYKADTHTLVASFQKEPIQGGALPVQKFEVAVKAALNEKESQPPVLSAAAVSKVEESLKVAGFDAGGSRELTGAKGVIAVKQFQASQGLPQDGKLGPITLDHLSAMMR